ncbi:hypothetical protein DL768_009153 [Monosporascus sp. mg162]|nr:hypothetical protein DL768_009153 [Monosporascus sp. mg162]
MGRSNFACDHCKNKKLNCTREKTGCQRCTASKILCRYTRAIKAAARNHESAVAPPVSSPVNATPPSSVAVRPGSASVDDQLTSTNAIMQGTVEEDPRRDGRDGLQEEQADQFQPPDVCGPITVGLLGALDFENRLDAFERPGSSPPGTIFYGSILLGGRRRRLSRPSTIINIITPATAPKTARPEQNASSRTHTISATRAKRHHAAAWTYYSESRNGSPSASTATGMLLLRGGDSVGDPLQIYQILAFYKAAVKHCADGDAQLRMGHGGFMGAQGTSARGLDVCHGFAR